MVLLHRNSIHNSVEFCALKMLPALILTLCHLFKSTAAAAVDIDTNNLKTVAYSNELLLLFFYSDRCKFSAEFLPIFDAAADRLRLEYGDTGKVTLGKVDCVTQRELSNLFNIQKFPTVKIIRLGRVSKTEYRGQRSIKALSKFVRNELKEPTKEFSSLDDLQKESNYKYLIIGYFQNRDQSEYQIYRRAAISMKDVCQFHVNFAKNSSPTGRITFTRDLRVDSLNSSIEYSGNMTHLNDLIAWIENKCARVVRELTFNNAEEISEEGRPLLVLFHSKNDTKVREEFEGIVETQFIELLHEINFLTADGKSFVHPLFHIGKSEKDLPLIAIDSFDHMYIFEKYQDVHKPGVLKQFISKFLSGELHMELHIAENAEGKESFESDEVDTAKIDNWLNDTNDTGNDSKDDSPELSFTPIFFEYDEELTTTRKTLPQSKFKELLPSKLRYTFVKDEL